MRGALSLLVWLTLLKCVALSKVAMLPPGNETAITSLTQQPIDIVCPPDILVVKTVPPGCQCTPQESPEFGACPAGYQCSVQWMGINWQPLKVAKAGQAICVPCVYGQYCPRGSFQPAMGDSEATRLYVEKYLCRPGFYCPLPDRIIPCPPGHFCPKASVESTTCDYQQLLDNKPQTIIPAEPKTVTQQVYITGTPIGGNFCPPTSTTPSNACGKGYYCPNTTAIIPCPAGYFCKWYSTLPKRCPWLATCPSESGSADLSLGGFLGLMLILGLLWLAYVALSAYIRLQQDRLVMKQAAKDKLQRLVAPLLGLHDPEALAFKAFGPIRPRISLRFEECGLRLKDGTTALSGVTGYFGHSKVSAVMGPSGAGKSTLLYVLMGVAKYGVFTGQVWVNGRQMRVSRLRRIMGYVPQDDIVHEDLTVRENLAYSAWLRSTVHMNREAKGEVVDDVIDLLRLRHVQHSLVGSVEKRGISGGQRKRVNIGLELVSKPSLLFMDEPTSGLDATAATDILAALRRMADLGMNIVTVVHQPRYSVFTLFHEVLFLGKGGRTVFLGPATAAVPYFISLGFDLPANENPADFCLDIISGIVPCPGRPNFQTEDLYSLWEAEAANWAGAVDVEPEPKKDTQKHDLSPEQLQLVSLHFDKVDREGTGQLTPEAITAFLEDLGMEPTTYDIRHIMGELDPRATGAVSRDDFLNFIRNGGRKPGAAVGVPLDRRVSIELDADKLEGSEPTSAETASRLPESSPADDSALTASTATQTLPRPAHLRGRSDHDPEPLGGTSPPRRYWPPHLRSSAANGSVPGPTDEERGMSPTVSQQWDFETMSTLSLPQNMDDVVEEPQKPPGCIMLILHRIKSAGKAVARALRRCKWRKRSRYRSIPGTWAQFSLLFRRAGVKWVRGWGYKFIDLLLFVTAALVIGAVHGTAWELERVRGNAVMSMLTLSIISVVASLSVFGKDRVVFWRESAAGLRTSAFFFGHAGLNLIDITVQPAIFMSVYYTLTLPEIHFVNYYIVAWLVAWYASGLGYLASVAMAAQNSMVAAATSIMILGGFLNGVDPRFRSLSPFMKHVIGLSYGRWAVEAVTIQEFRQYAHYLQPRAKFIMNEVGYCGLDKHPFPPSLEGAANSLDIMSYCGGYIAWDYMSLFIQGAILRALTYIWLRFWNTNTRGNPVYRVFTAFWVRVLRSSRRRWRSLSCRSVASMPATVAAGAAVGLDSSTEPLLGADSADAGALN